MKLIWALILAGVCGFMSYGLWVDSEKETKNETLVNHEFLNSFEDVISWQPAESAVNLNEIPNWQTLSKSTGSNELINNLIASFSEIGVSAELNLHVFLSDKGSMVRITSTSEEISALFGSIFSVAMHENNQLLSKGKLSGRRIEGMGFISSNSEFLEKTFQVVENQKPLDIPMGKLFWKTNSHANIWFERDEITVNGPAVIEFKKRNGFLYGYCFIQDSLINDENLGVTYSIWDFQLPGNPQSFTVEPFPVRDLDKTQVKEVEEICNCDVKTAWKSWNTHQVYLFNQDGLQFYGVQALEDLPATSGLYPFIADGAKMYKGYQIQELISGADVSGIYSDMFGREVSHFIDLEEQVFFFSALSEAKDFITLIQNKSFNYLVDSRLQELLLLSPDFTEYNGISSTGEPVVYQFEQKDNGGYYHALWKSEGTSAFITSNASSSKADSPSQEPNKNTGVSTELWEKQIEGKLVKSPFLFTNHYTKAKELALVTDKNELVLMSAEGEILWSRKLEEEILGEIHQVDLFRNNKFQMVFSTRKQLYAIDRNGKDVENFPVKLESSASAPVSVLDYDKKRKYRLLIPLENGMLVNYSKEGKKVNGWKHKPEDSPLVSEILHTIIGRKDYLIGIKKNGKVAIYKRDGKTRYTQDLELSNYSGGKLTLVESSKIEHVKLLYLDQSNNLVQTTLSLDNTESENLGLATANFTLIKNMVDGKAKDFIVARAERLAMYNEDYELKFTCDFSSAVKSEMQMFTWNKTNYIGLVSGKEVHIVNMDGETISGFPLYGEFGVTISDLDRNGKLNLITTDDHGLVMCYELGL